MSTSPSRKTGRKKRKEDGGALYFQSLSVKNIRCFGPEEQVLNLTDKDGKPAKWTLLLGDNGTGKTTLLQCLSMTKYGMHSGAAIVRGEMSGETRRRAIVAARDVFLKYAKQSVFWMDLFSGDSNAIVCFDTLDHSGDYQQKQSRNLVRAAQDLDTLEFGEEFLLAAYGPSRRLSSSDQVSSSTASLFDDDALLQNPRIWLRELDYAAAKAASEKSSIAESQRAKFDMVRSVLIDLLPDVSDIRITSPTRERPEPDVEFCTCYGWVPLGGVAYGYQSLVAWVVDFASRLIDTYPDSPLPLHEPAICLVDEIDLHLHPSWQREVMGYLSERFPKTQFIATAHSPLIVQAAPTVNANVAVLRRVRGEPFDHVEIDNDPEMIRGWRLDQILASDLFSTARGPVPLREPGLQEKIDERRRLLAKGKLTSQDKKRIQELEAEIGMLPVGETPEQIRAMQLLNESLEQLKTSTG